MINVIYNGAIQSSYSLRVDQDGVRCDTFHLISDQLEARRSALSPYMLPGLDNPHKRCAISLFDPFGFQATSIT
jgi:hypothetical protein